MGGAMTISETLFPRISSLGPMQIRRVLPAPERQMVGPFIFMDQGGPQTLPRTPKAGVPEHPHAGLSTFTYLLRGRGLHRDSAGHSEIIEAGDIALMSAGKGITHEEVPAPDGEGSTLQSYFVQMWLALPDEHEDMNPTFERHKAASLPLKVYPGGRVRLLMGTGWGETAPTTCHAETIFADIELNERGMLKVECACVERGIFVLEGQLKIGEQLVEQHTLALLEPGGEPEISSITGCRAILLGGAKFPSRRHIQGSFVASSMEKLRMRQEEYTSGKFPSIRH